jgi:hypothetical protein
MLLKTKISYLEKINKRKKEENHLFDIFSFSFNIFKVFKKAKKNVRTYLNEII